VVLTPSSVAAAPTLTSSAPETLAGDFKRLESKLHAEMGMTVSAVGANRKQFVLGDLASGPAWSTMKVPLTITALREEDPPAVTDTMRAAITESDNAAAEVIWAKLGDPVTAAHKVEAILGETGDPTTVEWRKVRAECTAFGQTDWPLTDQVRFTSVAACDSRDAPIFALMGQIETDQRWGLGLIPGSRFKGGWGPSPAGKYLVRQIGVLNTPSGMVAVAVAAQPASGSFNDGAQDLTEAANWLTAHIAALPMGRCDH
jgi:hypothetical protein